MVQERKEILGKRECLKENKKSSFGITVRTDCYEGPKVWGGRGGGIPVPDVFNHCMNVNVIKLSYFVHWLLLIAVFFLMLMDFIKVCTCSREHIVSTSKCWCVLQNARKNIYTYIFLSNLVSSVLLSTHRILISLISLMYKQIWTISNANLPGFSFGVPWLFFCDQTLWSLQERVKNPVSVPAHLKFWKNNDSGLHVCNHKCRKSDLLPKQRSPMNPASSICFSFQPVYFEKHEEH